MAKCPKKLKAKKPKAKKPLDKDQVGLCIIKLCFKKALKRSSRLFFRFREPVVAANRYGKGLNSPRSCENEPVADRGKPVAASLVFTVSLR